MEVKGRTDTHTGVGDALAAEHTPANASTEAQNSSGASDGHAVALREWPALLARYAWTRPLVLRAAGVLAIAYMIVVAIDGGYAIVRWLFGFLFALLGWGLLASASRLSTKDLKNARRRARVLDPGDWLDLLFGLLPLRVARGLQRAAGALLVAAGLALAGSSVLAL